MTDLAKKLLASFGYAGDEILAHPVSGDEQSAKEWADEAHEWAHPELDNESEIYDNIKNQFDALIQVK